MIRLYVLTVPLAAFTVAGQAQFSTAQAQAPGAQVGVTAFVGVAVIPMDTERVLPAQTVLVQDGRITALGPANRIKVPVGARQIDGRGQYLIPGLADMHSHDHEEKRKLAEGVTTLRNMSTGPMPRPNRVALSDSLVPHFYTSSKWEYADAHPGRPVPPPDSVAAAVAAYQAAGYDHIKPYWESREVFELLGAAARRIGLPIAGHVPPDVPLAMGLANMKSIEHLRGYLQYEASNLARPLLPDRAKFAEVVAAYAAQTRRAGVWNCPTLTVLTYNTRTIAGVSEDHLIFAHQLVKALQDAGAGLLLGTDGFFVSLELAEMVRAGLTPYQALATGTRNVAQYFGILDSSGTVAVGKRADLVLLPGNPLADIWHTREPVGVMLRGRWLDRAALDELLMAVPKKYGRARSRRDPLDWLFTTLRQLRLDEWPEAQHAARRMHFAQLRVWADSLATEAKDSERQRLRERMTEQFGIARTRITPERREGFDLLARVWLREQVRQGAQVTIPGVAAMP